jgi:Zn finger protein HypA/HybF involved in hydrogenase expression
MTEKIHPSWNDYPHLVAELDPDGNKGLTHRGKPVSVLELAAGTVKRLDWKCSTCGHKWKTSGNNRKGCPPCRKKQSAKNKRKHHLEKNGSMSETHPELALDYVGDPTQVIAGTRDKLDWKCHVCSHEWQAYGYSRASGIGCPYCSATNTPIHSDGRNSLATMFPELASEYQGDAAQVLYSTEKILLWKCRTCDHEWRTNARNRTKLKSGCPACAISGFKPDQLGYYYVHKITSELGNLLYYKGGISGDWQRRLSRLRSELPAHLSIENCEVISFEVGQEARDLETTLLRMAAEEGWKAPAQPFDGGHELFTQNPLDVAREKQLVK